MHIRLLPMNLNTGCVSPQQELCALLFYCRPDNRCVGPMLNGSMSCGDKVCMILRRAGRVVFRYAWPNSLDSAAGACGTRIVNVQSQIAEVQCPSG